MARRWIRRRIMGLFSRVSLPLARVAITGVICGRVLNGGGGIINNEWNCGEIVPKDISTIRNRNSGVCLRV